MLLAFASFRAERHFCKERLLLFSIRDQDRFNAAVVAVLTRHQDQSVADQLPECEGAVLAA